MATREGDHVDEILDEWRRVHPSVDASPIGITGRVTRIALYTERSADDHLERYRLTPARFEALLALEASASRQLSPTLLARGQRMSSAGITGLVDQLVALGLAARSRERHDRRRVQVSLTHQGSEMVAVAGAGWRRNQQRLVRTLGADTLRSLDRLLGRLVTAGDPGASLDGTSLKIARIAVSINTEAETVFSRFGVTHAGFQVLASLYRAGPPYRRSPSRVARGLMLSGAGLTGRMDQLERTGLLRRRRDREDRRAVVVELSHAGRSLVRAAFPVFVASHVRMLSQALEPEQQSALSAMLRTVLQQIESSEPLGRA
ncbi:MAG: winged helix-turn-helix transcriptional regulator [Chloroflexi bacterium]|nr:MAG: winged helix-turn-helix transcriptional regulator [Chloroflexota bacterium]